MKIMVCGIYTNNFRGKLLLKAIEVANSVCGESDMFCQFHMIVCGIFDEIN